MNLRLAPEQIRFRIAEAELSTLIATGSLSSVTTLAENLFLEYTIRTVSMPTNTDGELLELTTRCDSGSTHLDLTVFSDGIEQLQSDTTAKDGIKTHQAFANGDMLTVWLEIDLHSKKGAGKS